MTTTTRLAQELSSLNWSAARLILIAHFLRGVLTLCTVNLMRLAGVFNTGVEIDFNYKRLQRFFRHFELDFDAIARLAYLTADRVAGIISYDIWYRNRFRSGFGYPIILEYSTGIETKFYRLLAFLT